MRADEESVKTSGAKSCEIAVCAQSGFADGDAVVRNAADQLERSMDVNAHRLKIAVVYPQNARTGCERAIEFFARVDLDQRLHADFAAQHDQVAKKPIVHSCNDEQKTVGVIRTCFPNLPGVKNKIFAQDRQLNRFAGVPKILR